MDSINTEIKRFTHKGLAFILSTELDGDHGSPWDDGDGNGVVTGWVSHEQAGLREYSGDDWRDLGTWNRRDSKFYDVAATRAKAIREGWGLSCYHEAQLAKRLGHAPTPVEVIEEAINRDFDRHAGWFRDEWHYVGVIVTLVDLPGASASLWGIEDHARDYIERVANELAEQVIEELPAKLAQVQAKIDALRLALGRII